jgi:signal transduction histidine kinase
LGEVVAQAVELVRVRARQQGVEIAVHGPEEGVPVNVDKSLICTVLVNLFLNALDAMPHGGRLEVAKERSAGETRIHVTDTGSGIPPEIVGRLFTPFASSKPTGTGLGLSISRRIVDEHGGRISGGNRPEGGACFTIALPAAERLFEKVSEKGDGILGVATNIDTYGEKESRPLFGQQGNG